MRNLLLTATRRGQLVSQWARGAARGLAVVAMILAGGPLRAANADVTVTVTAVPTKVSVSRTVPVKNGSVTETNYAAYSVNVSNATGNVINQVTFSACALISSVTPFDPTGIDCGLTATMPTAKYVETIAVSNSDGDCPSPGTDVKVVNCNIGQLRPGPAGAATFILIFEAPASGALINLHYTATYSNGASPGTPSSSFVAFSGDKQTELTTTDAPSQKTELKTFVPSAGATFFTGTNSVALSTDRSTTRMIVPSGLELKNPADVLEDDGGNTTTGLTNDTLTTNTTTISIPTTALFNSPVTIYLQRDSSTIRSFNQIGRAILLYESTSGDPVSYTSQLQNCADVNGPSSAFPVCISQRIGVKKSQVGQGKPGGGQYTDEDVGDWIFILLALQNGKTSW